MRKKYNRHCILSDLFLQVKRERSGFKVHQISRRLCDSQRFSISFITEAFRVTGVPPNLSFGESAQLKSPPITILS